MIHTNQSVDNVLEDIKRFFDACPSLKRKTQLAIWQRFAKDILEDRPIYRSKNVDLNGKYNLMEFTYYNLDVYYFLRK